MSRKKNNKLSAIIFGPVLVFGGIMALWENEGRFDYYAAARDATVISSPGESAGEAIAFTDTLVTDTPINGDYVAEFVGFHVVSRYAEIYSWDKSEDSDGNTTWDLGWYSTLDGNSRNDGLRKTLTSGSLYPDGYALGPMEISEDDIHFVDDYVSISPGTVRLSRQGNSLELLTSGGYFLLNKGRSDNLGDERISFRGIPNAPTASYFGVVVGGVAVGKQFEDNDGVISEIIGNDGVLHHLVNGPRDAALVKIKEDITQKTWMVRIGGTIAIVIGIYVFFSVFMSLLYRIPFIGAVVSYGVLLISLVLGLSLALTVILAGMIFHNPLTVALPLAMIVGTVVWFIRRSKSAGDNAKRILAGKLAARKIAASAAAKEANPGASAAPPPPPPASTDPGRAAQPDVSVEPPVAHSDSELIERTFTNLALVAMSEGKLHRKENKFLTSWGKDNGVSSERMKQLFEVVRTDSPESHPASRDDLELMACMAMADGVLSTDEWRFLRKIAVGIGMEPHEVRSMLRDIETGTVAPA